MSNATVNRIGFEIPAGYAIRDHIMWSKNVHQIGKLYQFETVWTSVSGTNDVRGDHSPRLPDHLTQGWTFRTPRLHAREGLPVRSVGIARRKGLRHR